MIKHSEAQERALIEEAQLLKLLSSSELEYVRGRYEVDHRYYHTWDHALDVLTAVLRLPHLDPATRNSHILAAVFHDVVYVVGSKDNEVFSAVALRQMSQAPSRPKVWDDACELIHATADHATATWENTDRKLWDFLDCDILGIAEPCWPLAIQNDWDVGAELVQTYGLEATMAGRKSFMEGWLAKPSVFLGEFYGATHEWQARQNIRKLTGYEHHDFSALGQPTR